MFHFTLRAWRLLGCLLLLCLWGGSAFAYDVTVAQDGTGNYTTVQAAINAAPTGRTVAYTIFIRNGRYREKISVPTNKPFLQLVGESVAGTILSYDDGASTPAPGGGTVGTQNSASFSISADDFSALNITFENSFGDGSQAVAVLVNADRAAFKNCRFLGNQDTIYLKGNGTPRHFFKDCYIDGNVDFIFGSSVALFENCVVYAKARANTGSSFITAANTPAGQAYGFVFKRTKLPANTGGTAYYLGRPWQNSTGSSPLAGNKTVFIGSTVGAGLLQPAGWTTWDAGTNTSLITYAEFRSRYFSGGLLPTGQRVAWSQQLAVADTARYGRASLLGSWDPCAVATGFCTGAAPDLVVSNFRAAKGAAQATLSWNISWPMSQVKYELFRSADNTTFSKIYETTATTDSLVNFQTTDALPAAGTAYYYYLRASRPGVTAHTTETVQVSSIQTLTTTGTPLAFTQYCGAGASAAQTYTLSGVNLTGNVTVTPPAGFEVSTGGTWYTNASPLVLTPTNNAVSATISVRLNAGSNGAYAGSISHASPGATAVAVPVSGSRVAGSPAVSLPLQWWPLKVSNQDSAAVRSVGVTASTPVLRNLYVSNGTTVTTPVVVRPYSSLFGQAFGATSNGDGSWGTTSGGPGGNLSRRYYEQFTVTAAAGRTVRVDSLILTSAFYNTSSNTRLAVVWSRSNFAADSADVLGGYGPGGALGSGANGAFGTPIALANQTAGTTNTYRLLLRTGGVTLAAGQTLTIRLYFSCSSSSAGRYAMVKNVLVTGENITTTATKPLAGSALHLYPNPTADGRLTLTLTGYHQAVELTVLSAVGQVVQQRQLPAGQSRATLDLGPLPAGIYLLRATTPGGTDVRRVVRE